MFRRYKKCSLVLLAIAAIAMFNGSTSLAATTLIVDDDLACPDATYSTIGAALAVAVSGDTIKVCAGTYPESVTIGIPLTVLGPNVGTSALAARVAEAVVTSAGTTFNVTDGTEVTIDGFTITGDFGVYVSGSVTDTVIANNIITGTSRALSLDAPGDGARVLNNDLLSPVRTLHVSGGSKTVLKINGNRFSGNGTIFFLGTFAIAGFEFKDNHVQQSANIAANISGGTVSGNLFDAPVGSSLNLQISLHSSTLTGNTFDGKDANAGLQVYGSQFALVPSDHVTISGNLFKDCGAAAPPWNFAIQLSPDIHHIIITGNEISSGVEGVNTRDSSAWDVTGKEIHVNQNNITGNTGFGVRNGQSGILDAECNWWGAANGPGPVGPGSGDKVSPNVDYSPWLLAPAPGGACGGAVVTSEDQCKKGGWQTLFRADGTSFKNQGDCIQYVETGK